MVRDEGERERQKGLKSCSSCIKPLIALTEINRE